MDHAENYWGSNSYALAYVYETSCKYLIQFLSYRFPNCFDRRTDINEIPKNCQYSTAYISESNKNFDLRLQAFDSHFQTKEQVCISFVESLPEVYVFLPFLIQSPFQSYTHFEFFLETTAGWITLKITRAVSLIYSHICTKFHANI